MDLDTYFEQNGGVASVGQLAEYLGVSPASLRGWASENGLPIIGNAYAFTLDAAQAYVDDVLDEGDEDADEEDDEGEDELDEDDEDEQDGDEDDEDDDEDDE